MIVEEQEVSVMLFLSATIFVVALAALSRVAHDYSEDVVLRLMGVTINK